MDAMSFRKKPGSRRVARTVEQAARERREWLIALAIGVPLALIAFPGVLLLLMTLIRQALLAF